MFKIFYNNMEFVKLKKCNKKNLHMSNQGKSTLSSMKMEVIMKVRNFMALDMVKVGSNTVMVVIMKEAGKTVPCRVLGSFIIMMGNLPMKVNGLIISLMEKGLFSMRNLSH
jgi:hypothetical protein